MNEKTKVKITEVKEITKINKKGEVITDKSVKLTNQTGNLTISLKGNLAKEFVKEDRGKKAEITITFEEVKK